MLFYLFNELLALYMVLQTDLKTQNITEYASRHLLIAFLFGCLFAYSIFIFLKDYISKQLLYLITVLLLSSLIIPYHYSAFLNQIHSIFGVLAVTLVLVYFTYYIYIYENKYFLFHVAIMLSMIYLFFYYSVVNGILEIYIITYINLLMSIKKWKS